MKTTLSPRFIPFLWVIFALPLVSCEPKAQWQTYRNDLGHFSVESPYLLSNGKRDPFPVYMFTDTNYKKFKVEAGFCVRKNNWSIDKLEGFMNEGMEKRLDQSGYNEKSQSVKIPGGEARMIDGNLARDGKLLKIKMLLAEKEKNFWLVIVSYDGSDDVYGSMADRVIKSFQILN